MASAARVSVCPGSPRQSGNVGVRCATLQVARLNRVQGITRGGSRLLQLKMSLRKIHHAGARLAGVERACHSAEPGCGSEILLSIIIISTPPRIGMEKRPVSFLCLDNVLPSPACRSRNSQRVTTSGHLVGFWSLTGYGWCWVGRAVPHEL